MTRIVLIPLVIGVLAVPGALLLTQGSARTAFDAPAVERQRGAAARPGALPAARDKPVLTVNLAGQPPLELDLHQLDSMPQVRATFMEPFVEHHMTFTGVRVADFVPYARASGADTFDAAAHDGFRVRIAMRKLIDSGAIIATRADGQTLPIANGGPTRLVFPDADHPLARNTDNWIWSIKAIELR